MAGVVRFRVNDKEIDFSTVTSFTDTFTTKVSETRFASLTSDYTYRSDDGMLLSHPLNFTRRQPDNYDNESEDSTQWSNRKWLEETSAIVDRWQFETDGGKLTFIPNNTFQTGFEVNAYIGSFEYKFSDARNDVVKGSMSFTVGTAYMNGQNPIPTNYRTITYICNGDGEYAEKHEVYGFLPNVTFNLMNPSQSHPDWMTSKVGYEMTGWGYDTSTKTFDFGDSFTMPDRNVVLYGIWVKGDDYIITYWANSSTCTGRHVESIVIPTTRHTVIGLPEGWLECGIGFKGWGTTETSTNVYTPGTIITPTRSMSFYAIWDSSPVVTIYYGGGEYEYTVPPQIKRITAVLVGGGGGGGAGGSGVTDNGASGGGGGSGYVQTVNMSVTAGQTYTLNIGQGGRGGGPSNYDMLDGEEGYEGEDTSGFGVTASGGRGAIATVITNSNPPYQVTGGKGGAGYNRGSDGYDAHSGGIVGGAGGTPYRVGAIQGNAGAGGSSSGAGGQEGTHGGGGGGGASGWWDRYGGFDGGGEGGMGGNGFIHITQYYTE